MLKIENSHLVVKVKPFGAELCSVVSKSTGLEYIWQAGPQWPKHAPVLFPIVGQLKDNKYIYHEKEYSLDRHGFARTMEFELLKHQYDSIEFLLRDDKATRRIYPFQFMFVVQYKLSGSSLEISYNITNEGEAEMLFSVGAHPAFKIPLIEAENYSDYYLEFNQNENTKRWLLNNGLLENSAESFLKETDKLQLEKSLFNNDAIVFKDLASNVISIKNSNQQHGLHLRFNGFPYFGIWAAKDADFVCLEPWHGIADNVHSEQLLKNKEGIISLDPANTFSCMYSIEVF